MRIALVPTPDLLCETGSTLYATLLARMLAKAGNEVHVYALNHPKIELPGLHFHDLALPLEHPVFVDRVVTDDQIASTIARIVEAVAIDHESAPFDVVHAHYATITGYAGKVISDLFAVPLVVSCLGRDLTVGAPNDKRYARMVVESVRSAAQVLVPDSSFVEILVNSYQADKSRIRVLPIGIDDELFAPSAGLIATAGPIRILSVSSCFDREKGLDSLLAAAQLVKARGIAFELSIVGEDDLPGQEHASRLSQLVCNLRVNDVVRFVGRVLHKDIPQRLAEADIFVDPRVKGNFSTATLEALFAARPVLAASVQSNQSLVEDGSNGLLFEPGESCVMAEAIIKLARNPALRQSLRDGAALWRTLTGNQFSAEAMCNETLQTYRTSGAIRRATKSGDAQI
jgi:glycosyltransferase involved in cell wall biosynthesis